MVRMGEELTVHKTIGGIQMIKHLGFVSVDTIYAKEFHDQLHKAIKEMQELGLKVEIQYRQSDSLLSALLIGRKPKEGE